MTPVTGPVRLGAPPPLDPRAELRRLSDQMQAVFLNQLFQAMRASVPESGESDPGKALFTQMLDERVAEEASRRMERGIGEVLYRQMAARLDPAGPPEATK